MKIIKLIAKNFKGIKCVEIEPNSNLVKIKGPNGSGKSSILDAIESAIRSHHYAPEQPVRIGENEGSINLEIGDVESKITIIKEFDADGKAKLKVTDKDGKKIDSPRKMLDAIAGNLSYDPMEFLQLSPIDQVSKLKDVCGLNFDREDEIISKTEPLRLAAFQSKKGADHNLTKFKDVVEYKAPSVQDVLEERAAASKKNDEIKKEREDILRRRAELERMDFQIRSKRENVQTKRNKIEDLQITINSILCDIETLESSATELTVKKLDEANQIDVDENSFLTSTDKQLIDLSEFDAKLSDHQDNVKKEMRFNQRLSAIEDVKKCGENWRNFDDIIGEARKDKMDKIKNAKMPVEGLSIDEESNKIIYFGVNFTQVNTANQIDISTRMAMALNPKLKVIRIKNGSLLDEKAVATLEDIAEKNDYQLWVESVDECTDKVDGSFYVYEGELK